MAQAALSGRSCSLASVKFSQMLYLRKNFRKHVVVHPRILADVHPGELQVERRDLVQPLFEICPARFASRCWLTGCRQSSARRAKSSSPIRYAAESSVVARTAADARFKPKLDHSQPLPVQLDIGQRFQCLLCGRPFRDRFHKRVLDLVRDYCLPVGHHQQLPQSPRDFQMDGRAPWPSAVSIAAAVVLAVTNGFAVTVPRQSTSRI